MITWLHNTYQPELFEPFVPLDELHKIKIGRFSIADRWAKLFKLTGTNEAQIAANCIPSLALLEHAEKHQNLPANAAKLFTVLNHSYDFIKKSTALLEADFYFLLKNKKLKQHEANDQVYMEADVKCYSSFFNTENGPIYLSKGVQVQEGVCLRGPLYIGENTVIKMGATIYGGTIIGSNCSIGGEVKNSIVLDNSNKAHYGYLGDSMVGQWCNLGAGTSNSNVKNNASTIKVQLGNYKVSVGNKAGMLMGNFSRTAINTALNTGTVIGVCCNTFGTELSPKHLPHFSWGMQGEKYIYDKALSDIENWMAFKNEKLKLDQTKKLKQLYNGTI